MLLYSKSTNNIYRIFFCFIFQFFVMFNTVPLFSLSLCSYSEVCLLICNRCQYFSTIHSMLKRVRSYVIAIGRTYLDSSICLFRILFGSFSAAFSVLFLTLSSWCQVVHKCIFNCFQYLVAVGQMSFMDNVWLYVIIFFSK